MNDSCSPAVFRAIIRSDFTKIMIKRYLSKFCFFICLLSLFPLFAKAQSVEREFAIKAGGSVEVVNLFGRVEIQAQNDLEDKGLISVNAPESNLKIEESGGKLRLEAVPTDPKSRI